ncbi:hypothetical protein Leryth_019820 [Lithospermum erythrorhizon]|nr:hypothetical protein Leryth_019820 [Lithospermum erythrorhizon]
MRAILLRGGTYPSVYACGFYCNDICDSFLFAVFILILNSSVQIDKFAGPRVVWSANRNNPVKLNSELQLTSEGDLVLKDADGTLAWSTNTSGKGVAGLNITENGNLILFDANKSVVWQSFDHPTDSLLPGQRLFQGQKLISGISDTNWTQGQYIMSMTNDGLFLFIESNPPQAYANITSFPTNSDSYAVFQNSTFYAYNKPGEITNQLMWNDNPQAYAGQYMRLMSDGHLQVYRWELLGWEEVSDLTGSVEEAACLYPMFCGVNGICSRGQCTCPRSINDSINFFKPIDVEHPDLGCSLATSLTCNATQYHNFVDLENITYFTFISDISNIDVDRCKDACLRKCSCKAAIFRYYTDSSKGDCYMPLDIFSLRTTDFNVDQYNHSTHLKVQILPSETGISRGTSTEVVPRGRKNNYMIGSITGSILLLVAIIWVAIHIIRKRRNTDKVDEDYLDNVPGNPCRISYEELKLATENFNKKLGKGGFGSVFEGILKDGTRVAVKCLDGIGQVKKSFLAEVESIGSIHHVNLVKLVGFAAEKSQRLLVYEYMINGSLDRWIYPKNPDIILDWKCRRKIILDIAKGLQYLHEDCRQKIIHLDIKPQNILLDGSFNAKLSDFGLSKLIDRDQTQVVTTMRGTPGYLAPEWMSAVITEKVDVYSFGVVVLEILCGRKGFELSRPEEERHLLSLFKKRAMEGQMLDLVDKKSEDMQSHGEEVVEMMQLSAWCLLSDYTKRPSMSVVVKVLEGGMEREKNIDYNFLNFQTSAHKMSQEIIADATPLLASILSAPR